MRRQHVTITDWIRVYGLWILEIVILFGVFLLMRGAIRGWFVSLQISRWSWWAVDQLYVYIAAALWIAAVYFLEGYLRTGMQRGRFSQRVMKSLRIIAIIFSITLFAFAANLIYVRLFPA